MAKKETVLVGSSSAITEVDCCETWLESNFHNARYILTMIFIHALSIGANVAAGFIIVKSVLQVYEGGPNADCYAIIAVIASMLVWCGAQWKLKTFGCCDCAKRI